MRVPPATRITILRAGPGLRASPKRMTYPPASSIYTPRFQTRSANTGGASRLMRWAPPMRSTAMPSANAMTTIAHATHGRQCRARTARGNVLWCSPIRSRASRARRTRKAAESACSPTTSAAARLAHARSASVQTAFAWSRVSRARTAETSRAARSSMVTVHSTRGPPSGAARQNYPVPLGYRGEAGARNRKCGGSRHSRRVACFTVIVETTPDPAGSNHWLRPKADLTRRRSPSGESCDQAGTYVNLITSSPIRSLVARRSGGRGPAKNGLPRPSTTGWR